MKNKHFLYDLGWLTLLITAVYFVFLGIPALNPPDEPRYAEIPREMLFFHQFIIPHLNGLIYFEKPPLSYWLVAGFMKLFGYSEWAVRASVAIMGVLGCLATYATSRQLFNRRVGILSALILSSSLLYFLMSHLNTTDMSVSFCLMLSLYSFLLALQNKVRPTSSWLWSGYLFAGLAMMAKGLIGIAFPGMILLIWIAATKNWRLILKMRLISGFLIVLAVNLPWLMLAQKQVPDFLHYYFIVQQFERYATPRAGREMSIFAYTAVVLMASFPWTLFLPQLIQYQRNAIKTLSTHKNTLLLLFIWPAFITLFFAFSHSILIPYVLPILAPIAILFGLYFDDCLDKPKNKTFILSYRCYLGVAALLGTGLILFLYFSHEKILAIFIITSSVFLVTTIVGFFYQKKSMQKCLTFIVISTYTCLSFLWLAYGDLNTNSIKPLAMTINTLKLKYPDAKVINYGFYLQDLTFYTRQIVTVVGTLKNNDFNELTYGILHDPNSRTWMISYPDFWKQWNGHQRIFAICKLAGTTCFDKKSRHNVFIIQKTTRFELITNKDLT